MAGTSQGLKRFPFLRNRKRAPAYCVDAFSAANRKSTSPKNAMLVGAVLLGLAALTSPAIAETIPLPTPAPLPKEGVPPPPAASQNPLSGLASGFKSLFNLDKQPDQAAAPATTPANAFNPAQRAQVDKVSAYLSSVTQLNGQFVQVGP